MLIKQCVHFIFIVTALGFISACASQQENSVTNEFSLPLGLYGHAVVSNGEKIFVLAGSKKGGFSRDIYRIDPKTHSVIQLKDKLLPRRYHSAVWDGENAIYILGGVSRWKSHSKLEPLVEVFNIATQEVKIIGEMPVPRRFGSAVFIDGKIIVSGGEIWSRHNPNETVATNTVAIFDIKTNTWKKAADLPYNESTRTVTLNKQIYAIGGYDGNNASVHFTRYDVASDQWTTLPDLPQSLSAHSAVAIHDKIYTFGDYRDLNASYIYDSTTQVWQKSSFSYQNSRHNAATILNGKIYVIGGTVSPSGPFLNTIQTFSIE